MTTPTAAESPVTTASESAVSRPLERVLRGTRALGFATRASVCRMSTDPIWTENDLADLRREFGDVYDGRTVLVTGADGFMGSHLTDALVELGADVHAFVRATSSGALNNIGAPPRPAEGALRRPDRQDVDRLPRQGAARHGLRQAVRLPPRRAGARRRVVAPAVRDGDGEHDRDAQPAPVDRRLRPRAGEVRHRRHLGGVRQRPRVRRPPPRLRRRRRPDPARALADQPEVDLRDREGRRRLPDDELPRRVRRPRRRHADVQQLRAAPEPALRHRHDHHAGARAAGDRARRARAAARLLLLHRRRPRPPHRRRARASPATSTSTARARTSRWPTGPT